MIWLMAEEAAAGSSWLQSAVFSAIAVALVGGVFTTVQVVGNKRLRSPADRLAEVEFYVNLAKQQVEEAKADKKAIQDNLDSTRLYVDKLEADGRSDAGTIRKLYQDINALEARLARKDTIIRLKQATIDTVAQKLARDEPITLADLGSNLVEDPTADTGPVPVH